MAGRPRVNGFDDGGGSAIGPNYGQTGYPSTVSQGQTGVIYSEITGNFFKL